LFILENGYNTSSDSQDESQPVPPPRHKRKAKKTRKSRTATYPPSANNNNNNGENLIGVTGGKEKKSLEAKKEDLAWFSASDRFGIPLVPTVSGKMLIIIIDQASIPAIMKEKRKRVKKN